MAEQELSAICGHEEGRNKLVHKKIRTDTGPCFPLLIWQQWSVTEARFKVRKSQQSWNTEGYKLQGSGFGRWEYQITSLSSDGYSRGCVGRIPSPRSGHGCISGSVRLSGLQQRPSVISRVKPRSTQSSSAVHTHSPFGKEISQGEFSSNSSLSW